MTIASGSRSHGESHGHKHSKDDKNKKITELKEKLAAQIEKNASLQREQQILGDDRKKIFSELQLEKDRVLAWRDECDALHDTVEEYQRRLDRRTSELSVKDKELSQKNKEIAQKDKEIAQKDKDLSQKGKDLTQQDKEIKELKADKKAQKELYKELRDDDEKWRDRIGALNVDRRRLHDENALLKENETKIRSENGRLVKERDILLGMVREGERELLREEARRASGFGGRRQAPDYDYPRGNR